MNSNNNLPIAIIGAGPVGLAAAAHVVQRGATPIIFEAAPTIAGNIREWGHIRMFSPWRYNMDSAAQALLSETNWETPDLDTLPTGNDLIDLYLQPLADVLQPHIELNTKVTAISRRRIDKMKDTGREAAPFVLYTESDGAESAEFARAVIDASGTWATPNPIGSDGLFAPGERTHKDRIFYGIPDIHGQHKLRYADQRVAVIGGGHSAINALLELGDIQTEYPATELHWILRKANVTTAYGGLGNDALPGRGLLGIRIKEMVDSGRLQVHTPFYVTQLSEKNGALQIHGDAPSGPATLSADEIIAATGARPNLTINRELRLELDPGVESPTILAPMIDPNLHSCGTVRPHGEKELRHPEKDFYIVGMKSYGRAPTFLLATGYEQVRSVVAGLMGAWEEAHETRLKLPETGVCGVPAAIADPNNVAITACCNDGTADEPCCTAQTEAPAGEACCDKSIPLALATCC